MKQERKIIALDIGNVCVSIHPERVIARMNLFPTPEILAVSARLECGLISEREWLDFFHEKTGHRLNDDEMIDAWNLIIGDTLSGMPEAVMVPMISPQTAFAATSLACAYSAASKK